MNGLNPWIKGFWLSVGAFWLCGPVAYGIMGDGSGQTALNLAIVAAIATWIYFGVKFEAEKTDYERRLMLRKRLYSKDMEKVFFEIQKAMATAWKGEWYWQLRAHDLSTGYMLYTYQWREKWDYLDNGQSLYHANLVVQCKDQSTMEHGTATLVSFSFDGNGAWRDKQPMYRAISGVMGTIDAALPDHQIIKPSPEESNGKRREPVDREMQGVS